jgi:hypothetical protein
VITEEIPSELYSVIETLLDVAVSEVAPTKSDQDDDTLNMLMEEMSDMEANAASQRCLHARIYEDEYTDSRYFKTRESFNDDFPIHPGLLLTLRHSSKKSQYQQERKMKIHFARMINRAKHRPIGHRKREMSRVYQRSGLARSWMMERLE